MLKKFFLNLLSSFVGAWIALVLFGVVAVIVAVGVAARLGVSDGDAPSLRKQSIMVLDLKGTVSDAQIAGRPDLAGMLQGNLPEVTTLESLVNGLREGAKAKEVEGLYIKCNGISAGVSTLQTLRREIEAFRKSGKKVYAYGDSYTQADYYVASAADSVFVNAAGGVDLHGIGGTTLFLKGLFDKLGIQFQVFKVGTFKSAVEPYILTEMSAPARAQLDTLYGNMWGIMRTEIAASRKISPVALDSIVSRDFVVSQTAEWTVGRHLADRVVYQRQMDDIVGGIVDKKGKDVNFVDISVLAQRADWGNDYMAKKQVAVLYAEGDIAESDKAGIYCERLVPEIVKLADDDNIKGLVLRVNSPGGSVFGSEQIAEALSYFKSKSKPFAVSMGDYAASGGYWISADADRIFASPLTVTGSIGIFGLVPNAKGLAEKLGVNPQTVATNRQALLSVPLEPMTAEQSAHMQAAIERGYDKFVGRVAKGRNIPESRVRVIAEGRVWDGETALSLGLVDQLGTLEDAVEWVAGKAGIKGDYGVSTFPQVEPDFWNIMAKAINSEMAETVAEIAGPDVDRVLIREGLWLLERNPVQARMVPVTIEM